jgi:hypothetical protein
VVLVDGALARHGGDNRDLGQLGQHAQFLGGLGVEHTLARPDHRPPGPQQLADGVLDLGARRRHLHRPRRPVYVQVRHLAGHHVAV